MRGEKESDVGGDDWKVGVYVDEQEIPIPRGRVQNVQSYKKIQLNVKACRRKVRKTAYLLHSKFKKRHNSFINWRKETTVVHVY